MRDNQAEAVSESPGIMANAHHDGANTSAETDIKTKTMTSHHPAGREIAIADLAADVESLLRQPSNNREQACELARLLAASQARAVACWRAGENRLELIGFLATDDLPGSVRQEFVAAIRSVPLTAAQFGVVQAVSAGAPALNHRTTNDGPLPPGSIGWLVRLAAESSLAIPVVRDSKLIGAFAVATARRIEPDDHVWRMIVSVAAALSEF